MVEMKYTKFVLNAIKERIFGKPDPNTEITVKGKKVNLKEKKLAPKVKKQKIDAIKLPKFKIRMKSVSSISGVVMPIIMLMIGMTVFSSVSASLNMDAFSPGVSSMMNLIPLILVGAVVIGIVTTAFRISM